MGFTVIENFLLSLSTATDSLGVPLMRTGVSDIWEEQKKHTKCLQDPPDNQLYTVTGLCRRVVYCFFLLPHQMIIL